MRPSFSGSKTGVFRRTTMSGLAGKSDAELERLRIELALDPSPEAKIQLEQVIAEQRRRRRS
jgi:hypothetical protein